MSLIQKLWLMKVEQLKLVPPPRVPPVMIESSVTTPLVTSPITYNHTALVRKTNSMSSPESATVKPDLVRVGSRESHGSSSPANSSSPGARATPGSRSISSPAVTSAMTAGGIVAPAGILRPLVELQSPNSINLQLPPTCGAKQLAKLKRFLTTLQQFGSDISAEIGERVRSLVLALVNSQLSIEDFHTKLQETTNFPLKPFVIPFLKATLPSLQMELRQCAQITQQSPQQYLANNERVIFDTKALDMKNNNNNSSLSPEFREKGQITPSKRKNSSEDSPDSLPAVPKKIARDNSPPANKRTSPLSRGSIGSEPGLLATGDKTLIQAKDLLPSPSLIKLEDISRMSRARIENSDFYSAAISNTTGGSANKSVTHMSPPSDRLHPHHHGNGNSPPGQQNSSDKEDDNWRRVDNMLLNMAGMLEKTKSALSTLQESRVKETQEFSLWMRRHAEGVDQDFKKRTGEMMTHTLRQSEDRIAEIRKRSEEMVTEVKRQAIMEIHQAITAAEVKANELVNQERLRMENVLNLIKKTAKDDAMRSLNKQSDSQENCWNCGRRASETCSGCNKARYCGQFCQHKDWDKHHTSCGVANTASKDNSNTNTSESNSKTKADSKMKTTSQSSEDNPTQEQSKQEKTTT